MVIQIPDLIVSSLALSSMISGVEKAYDQWAGSYDDVVNPTRDLDGKALRAMLDAYAFENVLELGCGTGKNTAWLAGKATALTAVDLSAEMIAIAKRKNTGTHIHFIKADLNDEWKFSKGNYDLVTCNLILEHINDLQPVFKKAAAALKEKGLFFISELHPAKQYTGSKARFEKDNELIVVECFNHHLSDFLGARNEGFELVDIAELFDDGNKELPRLLSLLFRKKSG
jgi:predicted TPR repeat methyltransferase